VLKYLKIIKSCDHLISIQALILIGHYWILIFYNARS